jgi:hypothetical protein
MSSTRPIILRARRRAPMLLQVQPEQSERVDL